jgi:hypothetical protein
VQYLFILCPLEYERPVDLYGFRWRAEDVVPTEVRPDDSFVRDADAGAVTSAAGVSTLAVQEPCSSVPVRWQWATKEAASVDPKTL